MSSIVRYRNTLTYCLIGAVGEDLGDGSLHQHTPPQLLNDGDHLERDLTGPTVGVECSVLVMVDHAGVERERGLVRKKTCKKIIARFKYWLKWVSSKQFLFSFFSHIMYIELKTMRTK